LNKTLDEEIAIHSQFVERSKAFAVGGALILEPIDLSEICVFVAVLCKQDFLLAFVELLRSYGIAINDPLKISPLDHLKDGSKIPSNTNGL